MTTPAINLGALALLKLPDAALETRAQAAVRMANAFIIETPEDYQTAADELISITGRLALLTEEEEKLTKPLHAAHKSAIDFFRGPKSLLTSVQGIWKAKMLAHQKKVADEIAKATLKANEKADAEKKKLADEAAAVRAKAEKAAKELADAGLDAAAEETLQEGLFEAHAIEQAAAVVTAAPIAQAMPSARGTSTATKAEGAVRDKRAFLLFTVANMLGSNNMRSAMLEMARMSVEGKFEPVPDEELWLELWNHDSIKLKKHVASKGKLLNWPGVVVTDGTSMRASKG